MAFVPAPNIVQAEIRAIKAGINIENRIFVNCFHQPTASDLTTISTAISVSVNANWPALLPTDVTITELVLKSLHTQNDISNVLAFGGPLVGTMTGEPLPNQNSFCMKLTSGFTGRSARGRLYWLGLSIDQVVSNLLVAGVANSIQSALRDIRNDLAAAGYAWTIVSYRTNNAPRVGGPVYFEVQDAVFTDLQVDTQRGRVK